MVKVEINGQVIEAHEGDMLIDVADGAQIPIPRFCYHKKLSIAANCRMCLVEVEGAWKPLPACATPVTDGMKVHTKSPKAIASQKSVMEFLLINHPLDCPICDQGGECELQDVAMDYGDDVSRYVEAKRVVGDKNAGPLISTDMTRCIHCTRCVRFGQEVAGMMELGATGRSEWMEIGTYVEKSISSEMSGNMIDLCPVGALTSKPFRYKARPWELKSHNAIAAHDSLGSNIIVHTKNDEVMRVVPAENEDINEVWISDRDRFSYESINAEDRLTQPMIKNNGQWQTTDWESALAFAVQGLKSIKDSNSIGVMASANSTLEELHLLQKLARGLGTKNIDFRTRQLDFSMDSKGFHTPELAHSIAETDHLDAALLVGTYLRKELPVLNTRLRKAVTSRNAKVTTVNPQKFSFNYPTTDCYQNGLVTDLAAIAKAVADQIGHTDNLLASVETSDTHRKVANDLIEAKEASVMVGQIAQSHPDYAVILRLASSIARNAKAKFSVLPIQANEVGAHLVNFLPAGGKNAVEMLDCCKAFINLGLEPEYDFTQGSKALSSMQNAEFVVNLTAFDSKAQREYADVMLPIATFAETAGTFVNANGIKQSFKMASEPTGEAKAAWKILRVLGNLFNLGGFEYTHTNEVLSEVLDNKHSKIALATFECQLPSKNNDDQCSVVSPYQMDALVRRSPSLQATPDADVATMGKDSAKGDN